MIYRPPPPAAEKTSEMTLRQGIYKVHKCTFLVSKTDTHYDTMVASASDSEHCTLQLT
jgi:hypothetical protein